MPSRKDPNSQTRGMSHERTRPRYRGVVRAASGSLLIGGVWEHSSTLLDTEQEANSWVTTVVKINLDSQRKVAYAYTKNLTTGHRHLLYGVERVAE